LVGRPAAEDLVEDWQESMQVERAGPAPTDQRGGLFVARRDPLAELARQDVAARDRQASRPGPVRHGEVEDGSRSTCHGMTPGPRAAAAKAATSAAGPVIVRWW
jgi:hypothetical protein